jgi:hypothetical protein
MRMRGLDLNERDEYFCTPLKLRAARRSGSAEVVNCY